MKCTFCNNQEATCHLTKIVDGKVIEVHVCAKCIPEVNSDQLVDFDIWAAVSKLAASKGMPDPSQAVEPDETEAEEITAKSLLIEETGQEEPCPQCGFTGEQLRKIGRLGCPHCYETFKDMLSDVLSDCQKADDHTGKVPQSMMKLKVRSIQKALDKAVKEERFEEAAVLRDQLKTISE